MKILILGKNGNLGNQIFKVFSRDNINQVIAWGKEDIDITDEELIIKKIKDIKPNFIINCTSYNAVDKCEEYDEEYEIAKKINGQAVGFLAQAALETKSALIHFSSDYVFDGNNKEGYDENSETNPISRYAETKAMGEEEIIKRSGKGLKWYLIRTSKLFGPKGESENAKLSFFDLVLKLSETRDSFDMVSEEEISCFTYTIDLAEAVFDLIESDAGYGIYHIVNSGPASWYDGAVELFKIKSNSKIKINPVPTSDKYPRPAKRPKFSVLLNTKLKPLRSWKEALREYLLEDNSKQ
jgi:dTDP-4-dehydrorhamnose reductase